MQKWFLACVLTSVIGAAGLPVSGAGRAQTVLVIYSNERSLPANRQVDEQLRETLGVNSNVELTYQTEYLDYPRYADEADEAYDKLLSDFLRAKYSGHSVDVVVAGGPQAFRFLRRHQNDLFVDRPILVIAVTQSSYQDQAVPSRFLSIPIVVEPKPTLEMAVRLQPKACEMVIVNGASNFDLDWEKRIRSALADWQAHPPVRYLDGLPLSENLNELSRLPRCTIVYSPGLQRDGAGKSYSGRDSVSSMAKASSAPFYSSYGTMINYGIVGGYVFDMGDIGRQAGEVVRRILAGEKLTQKDMPDAVPSHYVVDWNQLERWDLSEADLPSGTIIVNREPSPWQKYKGYILGAVLVLTLQFLLIFYLLAERRRRRLTQKQLAESESLTGSILESLRSSVAVVDNDGTILEVNQRWLDFAVANSNPQIAKVTAGANYLDVCRRAAPNEETEQALRGIQSVLNGSQPMFEMDYSCDSPSEQWWFRMTVAMLPRNRGGAVISHLDVTKQKLAELEQRRMKEETAQMNRAREMGQLAASLTHELAQPLAAVLSNAQAAARLATAVQPDLPEIQEALADIIKDDKRACVVLDNVRAILKKHTIRPHTVNLNEIVEDVALIVRSDALLNGMQFRSMLCSDAVPVQGDEVPLQQVLLNLVNNSMAAMREIPREQRTLTIKTQVQNGFGWLLVEDEGPGIPDSLKANLFLPFFTTKSEGLGMGLSICATILESLGGSISFANLPGRGAAFSVQLRLAPASNPVA